MFYCLKMCCFAFFFLIGKAITMKKKGVLILFLFFVFSARGQEFRWVTGCVTDEMGQPLCGASVVTTDRQYGCATDEEGIFHVKIPVTAGYLLVSFIGMQAQLAEVKNRMQITLRTLVRQLDESLVLAYGRVRKKDFAGSAVSVDAACWRDRAVTVVTSALEGLVPGLQLAESDGQPGAEAHLRIRGVGSVNAGNEPVYVVDGAMFQGALCDINPNDIESVSVLKDAAATALYGSSAGNGVILITTKSARKGKPSFSFTMKQGFNERGIPEYERVDVWEYYPLQWEMLRNGKISQGKTVEEAAFLASEEVFGKVNYNPFGGIGKNEIVLPDGSLHPLATTLVYGNDLDWEAALLRKGYRSDYHLSYQMKGERAGLYTNLSYLKEQGSMISSGIERFSGMIKGSMQIVSCLKTGLSLQVVRTNCTLANTQDNAGDVANPFYFTRYIGPVYPIHQWNADGSVSDRYDLEEAVRGSGSTSFSHRNIVAETRSNRNSFERNGINGRGYAEIRLPGGWKATFNLTWDSYDYRRRQYVNNMAASSTGSLISSSIRTTAVTANQLVQYEKLFGQHAVTALAGHESYSYKYEYLSGEKSGQFLDGIYDMYNFRTMGGLISYDNLYRKEGYFGQAAYHYAGRYIFSLSWRRDGTSRFSKARRWGSFWSAGVAWNIREESWMKRQEVVDFLKLRASYGRTGNDKVLRATSLPNTFSDDYYPSQTFYNIGTNNGIEPGIAFSGFGNPALEWETQVSVDVAIEYSLLGWLSGSAGYFLKDSGNLLFKVPQVLSSGTTENWENVGKVTNRGIELALDFQLLNTRHWEWNISGNATFIRNKIVKMPASQSEILSGIQKLQAGKPMYSFWLKEYRGVNVETGDVQYAFDGKLKWDDKSCFVTARGDSLTCNSSLARSHFAGSSLPKVYGGLSTLLRYRNFDVSAIISYSVGGKVYNTGYQVLMYNGKYGQALHKNILRRWQQSGDVTDIPRLDDDVVNQRTGLKTATQVNAVSDRWLCKAGYLHLKTVTLRYSLPKPFLKRQGIQEAAIFMNGENLWLWSAMNGLDPRQLYKGVISVSNPPSRTYTVGVSFTL